MGSLNDLMKWVSAVPIRLEEHKNGHLERVAKHVVKEIKNEFGHYQDDWPDLADSTIEEKERAGYDTPAPLLRDGTLRDSYIYEIHGNHLIIGSTDERSIWMENGTRHMPPRPVLEHGLKKSRSKIIQEHLILAKEILKK